MPTGYTDGVYTEKLTFPQFVWRCARAMGALVLMRDEKADAPIPERFEPSKYTKEQRDKYRADVDHLSGMKTAECKEWGKRERDKRLSELRASATRKDDHERIAAYEKMLASVNAWIPPTPDHVGLKRFMVEQLDSSIKFDAPSSYYDDLIAKYESMTPEQFHTDALAEAAQMMSYYEQSWREEVERTEARNAWLKALRESVPYEVPK